MSCVALIVLLMGGRNLGRVGQSESHKRQKTSQITGPHVRPMICHPTNGQSRNAPWKASWSNPTFCSTVDTVAIGPAAP